MKYSILTPVIAGCALFIIATSCGRPLTPRERAVDNALLQPAEIPLGWEFEWFNRPEGDCKGRWRSFSHGDLEPNLTHVVFDCPTVSAAQALYLQRSNPSTHISRTPIGTGTKPATSDEFIAWCDVPDLMRQLSPSQVVSEKFCKSLARYGRVISEMQINAMLPTTTWPLEPDLLRWTIERNDMKLAHLPE